MSALGVGSRSGLGSTRAVVVLGAGVGSGLSTGVAVGSSGDGLGWDWGLASTCDGGCTFGSGSCTTTTFATVQPTSRPMSANDKPRTNPLAVAVAPSASPSTLNTLWCDTLTTPLRIPNVRRCGRVSRSSAQVPCFMHELVSWWCSVYSLLWSWTTALRPHDPEAERARRGRKCKQPLAAFIVTGHRLRGAFP